MSEVYRLIDRATGEVCGSYSRACHDETDFASVEAARSANCHGMFRDRVKYAVARYRVTEELIEPDADPPTQEELDAHARGRQEEEKIRAEMDALGLEGDARFYYRMNREFLRMVDLVVRHATPPE